MNIFLIISFIQITLSLKQRRLTGTGYLEPDYFNENFQDKDKLEIYISKQAVEAADKDGCDVLSLFFENNAISQVLTQIGECYENSEDIIGFAKIKDQEALKTTEVNFDQYYIDDIIWMEFAECTQLQCSPRTDPRLWNIKQLLKGSSISRIPNPVVDIYVLDTVINLNHREFSYLTTKVRLGGQTGPNDHGTHVAGTIMGSTVGILSDSRIALFSYGVCTGSGRCFDSDLFAGLRAVINRMRTRPGKKAVINMSLGGGCSICNKYDSLFAQIRALGGTIVVAAGNSNSDACRFEPAGEPDAISVGSYQNPNRRSGFSNWGNCVDTWGPGSNVYSASYNGGYRTLSGTSMASPAIAGLVGGFLGVNPTLSYLQLKTILKCPTCSYTFSILDARSPISRSFGAPCLSIPGIVGQGSTLPPRTTTTPPRFTTTPPRFTTTPPRTTSPPGSGCRCLADFKNGRRILNPYMPCSFSSTNEVFDFKVDFGQESFGVLLIDNDNSCKTLNNDDEVLTDFKDLTDSEWNQCKADLYLLLSNTDCGYNINLNGNSGKSALAETFGINVNDFKTINESIIQNNKISIAIILTFLVSIIIMTGLMIRCICKRVNSVNKVKYEYIADSCSNIDSDTSDIIRVKH